MAILPAISSLGCLPIFKCRQVIPVSTPMWRTVVFDSPCGLPSTGSKISPRTFLNASELRVPILVSPYSILHTRHSFQYKYIICQKIPKAFRGHMFAHARRNPSRCQHGPPVALICQVSGPYSRSCRANTRMSSAIFRQPAINSLSNPSRRVRKELFMPRRQRQK